MKETTTMPAFEAGQPVNVVLPAEEALASEAKVEPAPKGHGSTGKHPLKDASKAQLAESFAKDTSALAAVLESLGGVRRDQRGSKGQLIATRVYFRVSELVANRAKLKDADRKLASAAIDAARAVSGLRGDYGSIELFRESVAVRSRKSAGQHHKGAK